MRSGRGGISDIRAVALVLFFAFGASAQIGLGIASPASTCRFHLQGASVDGQVAVASIQSAPSLTAASILCTGGTGNIVLYGGPGLEPFASSFVGVTYVKQIQLPSLAIQIYDANLVVEDSTFDSLTSHATAAIAFSNSTVTFRNCSFTGNENSAVGGIYANMSSSITVLDSYFADNLGGQGGGIAVWNSGLYVNGTTFIKNNGNGQGGGIAVNNASSIEVLDSDFVNNTATSGGGLYVMGCSVGVSLVTNNFVGNDVSHSGGGLFVAKCSGTMEDNYFRLNTAANGAGVWQNNCPKLTHSHNQFDSNTATLGCGGIELNQGRITVDSCYFTKCRGVKGGAIYLQNGVGNIQDSIFDENSAKFGGAVFRGTTTSNLTGCSFDSNSARTSGAAIYDSHVEGDVTGSFFSQNLNGGDGSILFRTECTGQVGSDNRGLDTTSSRQVHTDNNSGSGDSSADSDSSSSSSSSAEYNDYAA